MTNLALGVSVFKRQEAIKDLLDSVNEEQIDRVIIGDNGKITNKKNSIYDSYSKTDLTVLDLEYDSGLGYTRKKIVEELEEDYLLVVDSDIQIPTNVMDLQTQLESHTDLGGVGGVLWEDERIRSDCYDLQDRGNLLLRSIKDEKIIKRVCGKPLVEFDVIQNVAIFQRECLEDYTWDPNYKIGWEHTDFFLGHKKDTSWKFAVNPDVLFKHNPGGSKQYMDLRRSRDRLWESKRHFLNKWGYEQVVNGQTSWLQTNNGIPSKKELIEEFGKRVILGLPPFAQEPLMKLRDKTRHYRGKPPF